MAQLSIEDRQSDFSMPLPGSDQYLNERSAGLDATPFVTFDTEDTFLTNLEQEGRASANGTATGGELATRTDYDNNPRQAIAEWCSELESLVNGKQGDGYTITRDYRSDSYNGTIETVQWSVTGGDQYEVAWNLDFIRGDGAGVYEPPQPEAVTPGATYKIAGETFDGVQELAIEVSQPFEVFRRAFAESPGDNDLLSDAGAVRRVTIIGEKVGTDSTRNTFDDNVTALFGKDKTIEVIEGWTGRKFKGMLDSYDQTDESGRTRIGEFAAELVEGTDA